MRSSAGLALISLETDQSINTSLARSMRSSNTVFPSLAGWHSSPRLATGVTESVAGLFAYENFSRPFEERVRILRMIGGGVLVAARTPLSAGISAAPFSPLRFPMVGGGVGGGSWIGSRGSTQKHLSDNGAVSYTSPTLLPSHSLLRYRTRSCSTSTSPVSLRFPLYPCRSPSS